MPKENNVFLTANTTREQIKTYQQEKTNHYFEEKERFKEQTINLQENKRTILGFQREDSKEMKQVKQSLQALNTFFNGTMPAQPDAFEKGRKEGHELYEALIQNCQTYITAKGNPITSSGKARLNMVKMIYHQCRAEEQLFDDCARSLYAEGRREALQWSNILGEARMAQINVDTMEKKHVEDISTLTRPILKLQQNETSVFFREEEKLTENDKVLYFQQYNEKMKSSNSDFSEIYNLVRENPKLLEISGIFRGTVLRARTEEEKQLKERLAAKFNELKQKAETDESLRTKTDAELEHMARKDPECRNLSYRLAGLTHLLDLFSGKSDDYRFPAEQYGAVQDLMGQIKDTVLKRENLQDKWQLYTVPTLTSYMRALRFVEKKHSEAKSYGRAGVREDSIISNRNVAASRLAALLENSDLYAKSRTAIIERNGEKIRGTLTMGVSGAVSIDDLEIKADANHLHMEYAPEAIRQLTTIQLMDTLFGCYEERSNKDYFAQSHIEGDRLMIDNITAVNTDYSFGDRPYALIAEPFHGTETPLVNIDNESICNLPAVDRQFYDHLMNLSPEQIDYTMKDLLTANELDALKDRLAGMKTLLENTLQNDPDFLVNKEDWENAAERFRDLDDTYLNKSYLKGNH